MRYAVEVIKVNASRIGKALRKTGISDLQIHIYNGGRIVAKNVFEHHGNVYKHRQGRVIDVRGAKVRVAYSGYRSVWHDLTNTHFFVMGEWMNIA